ncbi:MAG TPA: acyl-CoA dehydrogenase family protein, partial [Burkholderiales bacterium]|nr:acyl-CoA dehydrogenase family protein [Burkholderiales bacterium]
MNTTTEIRSMLCDAATRLFTDHVTQKMLDAAKQEGWSAALWNELQQAELPLVGVPEAAGGAGGALSDTAAVLRIAARHAAPVPLAETHMAGWLLASAGLEVPRTPLTIGPVLNEKLTAVKDGTEWRVSGALTRVPFARIAKQLVVLADSAQGLMVAAIDATQCRVTPGRNLGYEPRDEVMLDNVVALAAALAGAGVSRDSLQARGALLRAVQIGGALEQALHLACEYAKQRVQFGRTIAQFQAIQQELARCGGEVAAAVAAALSATGVVERLADDHSAAAAQQTLMAVAAAKIR